MEDLVVVLTIVAVLLLYVMPLKRCLSSMLNFYLDSDVEPKLSEVFLSLIPVLNIIMAYKTLELDREVNREREIRQRNVGRYPAPPVVKDLKMVEKTTEKNGDNGSIKFKF